MENNNSKQAILSIVGIAILVIAVVGVSFAFFTYSRTGAENNVITTGSITFSLEPGDDGQGEHPNVEGENTEPKDDDEGKKDEKNETDFSVSGQLPTGANPVKYVVYAIRGEKPGAEKGPSGADWAELPKEAIKMYLTVDTSTGNGTITKNYYETAAIAGPLDGDGSVDTGDGTTGFKIAEGTIPADNTLTTHKFKLHMWVTTDFNSGKIVSDTDATYKYRASATTVGNLPAGQESDERLVWTDQYYAVKIKVVASDDPNFNKGA